MAKKLFLFRNLASEDPDDAEMLQETCYFVASCLVAYAMGMPDAKTTVRPYGLKPARSTIAFLSLPSTTFALTLAVLYQCVKMPPHLLDAWIKKPRPNISEPWTIGMIKRFTSFQRTFSVQRRAVFKVFDDLDGEYLMGESGPELKRRKKKKTADACLIEAEDFE